MPLKLDRPILLYPPRPGGAINPATLNRYSGYFAQYKYNDIRTLVYFYPDSHIELLNRHKQPHAIYSLTESMLASLRSLRLAAGSFHVLDGGLMHKKTPLRDRIILWDVLVYDSQYLVQTTFRERYELLKKICGDPKEYESQTGHHIALKIAERLWLAPVFTTNLPSRYESLLHLDEIEGLVLKDPNGKLEPAIRPDNNLGWQIRVRKPHANYAF